ncbi:SAP domain containing protein [Lasiodiplodia theobromae]|uniref:SAP domain containing protein n=1 Tax=Lasiodiplodia theobromae TaxID=45133 RepID=UPI0015C3424F|nr:SAP domain containing protein [Lasiodiplodia theobromae]KAF4536877.1 SAP domain containing protein [Lasiodiplodia theobromae]
MTNPTITDTTSTTVTATTTVHTTTTLIPATNGELMECPNRPADFDWLYIATDPLRAFNATPPSETPPSEQEHDKCKREVEASVWRFAKFWDPKNVAFHPLHLTEDQLGVIFVQVESYYNAANDDPSLYKLFGLPWSKDSIWKDYDNNPSSMWWIWKDKQMRLRREHGPSQREKRFWKLWKDFYNVDAEEQPRGWYSGYWYQDGLYWRDVRLREAFPWGWAPEWKLSPEPELEPEPVNKSFSGLVKALVSRRRLTRLGAILTTTTPKSSSFSPITTTVTTTFGRVLNRVIVLVGSVAISMLLLLAAAAATESRSRPGSWKSERRIQVD